MVDHCFDGILVDFVLTGFHVIHGIESESFGLPMILSTLVLYDQTLAHLIHLNDLVFVLILLNCVQGAAPDNDFDVRFKVQIILVLFLINRL